MEIRMKAKASSIDIRGKTPKQLLQRHQPACETQSGFEQAQGA
jgi:hypothetical protein